MYARRDGAEEAAETSRRRPGAHDSVQAGGRKKPRDEHEPRATYHELQATSHKRRGATNRHLTPESWVVAGRPTGHNPALWR